MIDPDWINFKLPLLLTDKIRKWKRSATIFPRERYNPRAQKLHAETLTIQGTHKAKIIIILLRPSIFVSSICNTEFPRLLLGWHR